MKKAVSILLAVILALFCAVLPAFAYSSPFGLTEPDDPGEANAAAKIEYSLRRGGKFIYCNNPEALYAFNIGQALLIERNVCGEVYFTSENRNLTGKKILLGLQLRNDSGQDIEVKVKNIGYQTGIDWVGQVEWTDFFNTKYRLEKAGGNYSFTNTYAPSNFKEVTYTVPSGKYIYVMGGSSADSYKNINVGNTADKFAGDGQVVNGAVYFEVKGPKSGVSLAFVCYTSSASPVTTDKQQGYIVERDGRNYGRQYLGSAPYLCAQASMAWNVNDSLPDGDKLKVEYDVEYYDDPTSYGVYGAYTGKPSVRHMSGTGWFTHINPTNHNEYIGTDMMPFECVTEDGTPVVIDIYHNDGIGKPANIGNWMVVYEETLSFYNSGTRPRTFTLFLKNNGVLAVNLRSADGGLLDSLYHWDASSPVFSVNVNPGKQKDVYLEYVLLANSYGSIEHYITAGAGVYEYELGDLDCDGDVDSDDAIYLLRHVLFGESYAIYAYADFDGNGKVSSNDAIYLLRHVLFGDSYPLTER
ncbi:MAG: hypothetical protein IJL41_05185 [Clostridia bacterium]|nr:hypothetical protein [Clostridia bacterium]